jgi:16S rRNA (guanine527-N7)-methyltransferase
MSSEAFQKEIQARGLTLTETMLAQLDTYQHLLAAWNEKMNLTAVSDPAQVEIRHFLDCLLPMSLLPEGSRVIDVGSGAGFPGLVWAVCRPDLQVTLLEANGKRCRFLEAVRQELHLTRTDIVQARAEEYTAGRQRYDVAAARAVAALPMLAELCVPLIRVGGMFLAMKGPQGEEEARQGEKALAVLGCGPITIHRDTLGADKEIRLNLTARKLHDTPARYPRPYGQIKKKPLA